MTEAYCLLDMHIQIRNKFIIQTKSKKQTATPPTAKVLAKHKDPLQHSKEHKQLSPMESKSSIIAYSTRVLPRWAIKLANSKDDKSDADSS